MLDRQPTIRSRELGLALTRAAEAKGMNGNAIARRLGWSHSKVSRLLSGKRGSSKIEDVSAVLAICGITGPKRDELLEIARRADERGWWQEYGDRLPPALTTLSDFETDALMITSFENAVVPGLLQTREYMRRLMYRTLSIPAKEIPDRIDHRLQRQQMLDRRYPARFTFYLDEYALTRTGPGPEIMSDQVHHVLRMAVRPYVEVRIIPDAVGFHPAQRPFYDMRFQDFHPVVLLDSPTSALFLERPDTTAYYSRIAAYLNDVALDERRSREWLTILADKLSKEREAHDEDTPPLEEVHTSRIPSEPAG